MGGGGRAQAGAGGHMGGDGGMWGGSTDVRLHTITPLHRRVVAPVVPIVLSRLLCLSCCCTCCAHCVIVPVVPIMSSCSCTHVPTDVLHVCLDCVACTETLSTKMHKKKTYLVTAGKVGGG